MYKLKISPNSGRISRHAFHNDWKVYALLSLFFMLQPVVIAGEKLNILFLTVDDMNFNSIGIYGCPVDDITPNIDLLASEGLRFEWAYVQAPSCTPSRNVFHTGHYPHNSGVEGFFSVDFPQATLPEVLQMNGYFTGIIQKIIDSSPTNDIHKYWDYAKQFDIASARNPSSYYQAFDELLSKAAARGQPFYASVNIQDPHLPFFRGPETKSGFDRTPPSRIYRPEEVPIPLCIPQHEDFRQEVADYYSTVRRADDSVGKIINLLEKRGYRENTIIIFISDHGMSFPFIKSNLYHQGVRTPLIVTWPNEIEKGVIDSVHMVSAIDFFPTVLEITGIEAPGTLAGRSILPLLNGGNQQDRDVVFVEHNEGPTAEPRPMRAVHSKDYVYIFNPWGVGGYQAIMECRWYRSYATFSRLAQHDSQIRERFQFLNYRTVEELYDTRNDSYALNNLIDDPNYAKVANDLRTRLKIWMEETNDYALEGYQVRNDSTQLRAFMEKRVAISSGRTKKLEWKRNINFEGRPKGKLDGLAPANILY